MITAEGIDFMEANLPQHKTMYKMLEAADMGNRYSVTKADTNGTAL
jgi:hypothetical protein